MSTLPYFIFWLMLAFTALLVCLEDITMRRWPRALLCAALAALFGFMVVDNAMTALLSEAVASPIR